MAEERVNVVAGFWIRLLTKIIDLLIPSVISVAILFGLIQKDEFYHFKGDYGYYVWTIVTVLLILISFIGIPLLTKGRTLTMFVTRIKIVPVGQEKMFWVLVKREAVYSLAWVGLLLLSMAVINHTLVDKFARRVQNDITYSALENVRIGVVSTVGGFVIVIQLLSAIGIIVRRDKTGFHDRASQSVTVWVNKYRALPTKKFVKQIQPQPVHDEVVEWVSK